MCKANVNNANSGVVIGSVFENIHGPTVLVVGGILLGFVVFIGLIMLFMKTFGIGCYRPPQVQMRGNFEPRRKSWYSRSIRYHGRRHDDTADDVNMQVVQPKERFDYNKQ